ncbi:unnamed protein product [Boreogadus saida]
MSLLLSTATTGSVFATTNATNSSGKCVNIEDSIISDLLMGLYILVFIFGLTFNVLTLGPSTGLSAQAKRKVRLLSFGVIGIFSICFAPYHLLLLARSLAYYLGPDVRPQGSYCSFEQVMHFPFSCTLALSSLNCVVDPVLYVLVSNGVREEVKFCWRRHKKTPASATCFLNCYTRTTATPNLI